MQKILMVFFFILHGTALTHCHSEKNNTSTDTSIIRSNLCASQVQSSVKAGLAPVTQQDCINTLKECTDQDILVMSSQSNNNDILPGITVLDAAKDASLIENASRQTVVDNNGIVSVDNVVTDTVIDPSIDDIVPEAKEEILSDFTVDATPTPTYPTSSIEDVDLLPESLSETCKNSLANTPLPASNNANTDPTGNADIFPIYLRFETVNTNYKGPGITSLCCGNTGDNWGYLMKLEDAVVANNRLTQRSERLCYPENSTTASPHFVGRTLKCGTVDISEPAPILNIEIIKRNFERFASNQRTVQKTLYFQEAINQLKERRTAIDALIDRLKNPVSKRDKAMAFWIRLFSIQNLQQSKPNGLWINISDNSFNISDRCQNAWMYFENNIGNIRWFDCNTPPL